MKDYSDYFYSTDLNFCELSDTFAQNISYFCVPLSTNNKFNTKISRQINNRYLFLPEILYKIGFKEIEENFSQESYCCALFEALRKLIFTKNIIHKDYIKNSADDIIQKFLSTAEFNVSDFVLFIPIDDLFQNSTLTEENLRAWFNELILYSSSKNKECTFIICSEKSSTFNLLDKINIIKIPSKEFENIPVPFLHCKHIKIRKSYCKSNKDTIDISALVNLNWNLKKMAEKIDDINVPDKLKRKFETFKGNSSHSISKIDELYKATFYDNFYIYDYVTILLSQGILLNTKELIEKYRSFQNKETWTHDELLMYFYNRFAKDQQFRTDVMTKSINYAKKNRPILLLYTSKMILFYFENLISSIYKK